ncbi:MAG: CBS domain-containing protein [Pseudomonadota bacterium]
MMLVKELMTRKVYAADEDDNVVSVCKLLTKHNISGIPVVSESGKLKGFISERDIIAAVPKSTFLTLKAKQLMSRKVRTIPHDAPITQASKIFSEEKYRLLPVLKANKLVGIIARKDIVKQMIGHYY